MSDRPWHDRDVVLDTNVLIHLGRFDSTGKWLYETYLKGRTSTPLVSVVSVAEARVIAAQNRWSLDKNERLRKTSSASSVTSRSRTPHSSRRTGPSTSRGARG